jgi:mono/diheme cytochrome c family protein
VLRKERMVSPEYGGDNNKRAEPDKWPNPLLAFPAHWAPLQMAFYGGDQFPEKFRGGAFIAFHGSWNRAPLPQAGYCVGFVPFDEKGMPRGTYEVFANGFAGREVIMSPRDARFRACGLAVGPDGSLYVADSEKGRVWRIIYTGENIQPTKPPSATAPVKTTAAQTLDGAKIYTQNCASCHMADGGGVPSFQPALVGSHVVAGDPTQLIHVLLLGPAKVLSADREPYSNTMPSFAQLSDGEIAAVLTYIRNHFASNAPAIAAGEISSERKTGAPDS